MNPQIQQALSKFSALLESRNSFLSEIDSKEPLDNAGGWLKRLQRQLLVFTKNDACLRDAARCHGSSIVVQVSLNLTGFTKPVKLATRNKLRGSN